MANLCDTALGPVLLSGSDRGARFVDISSDHGLASPFWKPVLAWVFLTGASVLDLCALPLMTFWLPLAGIGFPLPIGLRPLVFATLASAILGFVGLSMLDSRSGWRRIPIRCMLVVAKSVALICVFGTVMIYVWNNNRLLPTEPVSMWLPCSMLTIWVVLVAVVESFSQPRRTRIPDLVAALLMVGSVFLFVLFSFLLPIDYALAKMASSDGLVLSASLIAIPMLPILFAIGLIIRVPSKRVVVFLRRFGYEAVNTAIREAVRQEVGSDFRLITLDDESFKSAGTPLRDRLAALGGIGLVSVSVFAAVIGMGWLIDQLEKANTVKGDVKEPGSGAIGGIEGWMYEILLTGFQEGILLLSAYLVVVLFLLVATVLIVKGKGRHRIRSARGARSIQSKLTKLKLRRKSPSFLGSQAVVVSVVDQMWRETVLSILRIADAVIVEVSTPSEAIAWEMAQIRKGFTGRVVLLAQRDEIARWVERTTKSGDRESGEVLANMRGLDVLIYDDPLSIDLKRLARQLQL